MRFTLEFRVIKFYEFVTSFNCLFRSLSLDNNDHDRELSEEPLPQDPLIQQQIIDPGRS